MVASKKMQKLVRAPRVNDEDLRGLTWEELTVLKDRGKLNDVQERKAGFRPITNGGIQESPRSTERRAPALPPSVNDDDDNGSDEEPVEYSEMTKAELQDEIDARNEDRPEDAQLPRTGSKDHLIAVLEADDEESDG